MSNKSAASKKSPPVRDTSLAVELVLLAESAHLSAQDTVSSLATATAVAAIGFGLPREKYLEAMTATYDLTLAVKDDPEGAASRLAAATAPMPTAGAGTSAG